MNRDHIKTRSQMPGSMRKGRQCLCLLICLSVFAVPVMGKSRDRVVELQGESEVINETYYESSLGYSLWYDETLFDLEELDSEHGRFTEIRPKDREDMSLDILPPETIGVLPWKYLELYAEEGTEYTYEDTVSGARLIWFELEREGYLYGYYAIETDASFAVAALSYPEEMDDYAQRLRETIRTILPGEAEEVSVEEDSSDPDRIFEKIQTMYAEIENYAAEEGILPSETVRSDTGILLRQSRQTGSDADEMMAHYGYHDYFLSFYYDTEDPANPYPRLINALIEGNEYSYYLNGNMLVRRVDARDYTDYPVMNEFMWDLLRESAVFER